MESSLSVTMVVGDPPSWPTLPFWSFWMLSNLPSLTPKALTLAARPPGLLASPPRPDPLVPSSISAAEEEDEEEDLSRFAVMASTGEASGTMSPPTTASPSRGLSWYCTWTSSTQMTSLASRTLPTLDRSLAVREPKVKPPLLPFAEDPEDVSPASSSEGSPESDSPRLARSARARSSISQFASRACFCASLLALARPPSHSPSALSLNTTSTPLTLSTILPYTRFIHGICRTSWSADPLSIATGRLKPGMRSTSLHLSLTFDMLTPFRKENLKFSVTSTNCPIADVSRSCSHR